MAYYPNNYSGYAPVYQPQYQQMQAPQIQPVQQTNSIIWVTYEEMLAYPVAPNSAVTLWDRNAPVIYLKKADMTGRASVTIYDLVERKKQPKQNNASQDDLYATKTDLKAVSDAVKVLQEGLEEIRLKTQNTRSGEGVSE